MLERCDGVSGKSALGQKPTFVGRADTSAKRLTSDVLQPGSQMGNSKSRAWKSQIEMR